MIVCFSLSMPNSPSWNGKWSGADDVHVILKTIRSKAEIQKFKNIINKAPYSYSWEDGWRASISVMPVDASTARRLRKLNKGFSGYNWMVDSIIRRGAIHDSVK